MPTQFTSFTGVTEAARAIQEFLFDRDAALPIEVRDQLKELVGPATSPVDAVVRGSEILYARRDELGAEAQALAAGLALVGQQFNFHGMAKDDRGTKMALGLMRDAKVRKPTGVDYPKKADDPEAKDEFKKKEEVEVPVEPVVVEPVVEDTPAPE